MPKQKIYKVKVKINDELDEITVISDSKVGAICDGSTLLDMLGVHFEILSADIF